MTWDQSLAANVSALLLVVTLVGLAWTGRSRWCVSFAVYLSLALGVNRLVTLAPQFWTYDVWVAKETAYAVLSYLVALEVALLTFVGLPRARAFAVAGLAGTALATLAALARPTAGGYWSGIGVLGPRGQAGRVWPFVVVFGVAAFYQAPFHWFHRGVLLGFVLYSTLYTGLLTLLGKVGTSALAYVQALDTAAYIATLALWSHTAWRVPPPSALGPAAHARLRPWET